MFHVPAYCNHPRLGNLNETRNASSPSFFLKNLNSVFESINICLAHKLFLQRFPFVLQ